MTLGVLVLGGAGFVIWTVQLRRMVARRTEELGRAEQKLDYHVVNSPLAVIEWDNQFRVLRWTGQSEQVFGWKAEEVQGKHPSEWHFVHEEDWAAGKAVMRQLLGGQQRRNRHANRNYRKDGSVIDCEWYNSTLVDGQGQVVSILSLVLDVTGQKATAEALRQSEEKFRSVFQQAAIGMGRVRFSDARWIDVNDTFCRMLGYSHEEMLATAWPAMTHPEDVDLDLVPFRRMAAGELDSYSVEKRFVHKQGHPVWARLTLSLVRDAQGNPEYEIAIIEDIGERKRAEEALRQSEERFRGTFENAAVGMSHADADGRFLRVNEKLREILDRRCEELHGRSFVDFTYPDDREPDTSQHAALWRGELNQYAVETRYIRPDGEPVWVLVTRSLQRDEAGQAVYSICIIQDISVRKRAEESLRQAVDRYERHVRLFEGVASTTPDFVYLFDLQGRFQYANRRLLEVWGMQLPEVIGKTCRELGYEQWHHDMHMREIAQVIRTKQAIKGEVPFRAPRTGLFGVYEYIFTPVIDPDGQVELVAGTTRDITERKRTEQQLKELNETLEQKVAEQTAEVRRRATQLQALAVQLSRAEHQERRRLAQMLHDHLQQLLVGAKFNLSILQNQLPVGPLREAAGQVNNLLNESLSASRSLTVELSPPVLYKGTFAEALRWLAEWMRDKHGLLVEVRADEDVDPQTEEVRVLLFQAVRELLFNVVKHARVSRARVRMERGEGEQVRVLVADEGPGFDPQERGPSRGGSGLGLFGIEERLELLGGRLQIDSTPGKGTRMMLAAPLRLGTRSYFEAKEPAEAASTAVRPVSEPTEGSDRIRVLLADDHAVVRDGLCRLLGNQPDMHVVGQAAHGQEAVELALSMQPDVVIMDISMPVLDGIEATRRITSHLSGTCVIGLSMHNDAEMAGEMSAAGAASYLTKTSPPEALLSAIRACARGAVA